MARSWAFLLLAAFGITAHVATSRALPTHQQALGDDSVGDQDNITISCDMPFKGLADSSGTGNGNCAGQGATNNGSASASSSGSGPTAAITGIGNGSGSFNGNTVSPGAGQANPMTTRARDGGAAAAGDLGAFMAPPTPDATLDGDINGGFDIRIP